MSETGVQIVFCTFPDVEVARQIGTTVIERQLAKCVNLIPSVESIYEWKGKLETGNETLAMFKVARGNYAVLETALAELHPYETPEILAVDVAEGLEPYLKWVVER